MIINGTGYPPFNDQKCCADSIDVGLELSANSAAGWRAPRTTYQVYYYDLNQQIRSWDGCTIGNPPYPNNCSRQDAPLRGAWTTVSPWQDYWSELP